MSEYSRTYEFRFMQRPNPETGSVNRVLQQKWLAQSSLLHLGTPDEEWRDIPLVDVNGQPVK